MLSPVYKIMGLFESLSPEEFNRIAPATRRRFADQCRRVIEMAEPSAPPPPKAGILSDLKNGARAD